MNYFEYETLYHEITALWLINKRFARYSFSDVDYAERTFDIFIIQKNNITKTNFYELGFQFNSGKIKI